MSLIYIQVISGFFGPVEWHFYQNISFGNVSVVFDKSSVTVMATDRREGVWGIQGTVGPLFCSCVAFYLFSVA